MNVNRCSDNAESTPRDAGYAIVIVALLAIPLLTAVGLAVDVGSWYLRSSQMQAAADAAALAGVVYQPDFTQARNVALEEAKANGFEDGVDGITIEVSEVTGEKLQVIIHDPAVAMFFSHLVLDEMTLTRSAVAEYLKPIPLGSESHILGNSGYGVPGDPNFWLGINGPYSAYASGDPFSTKCLDVEDPFDFGPANWRTGMAKGKACVGDNPQYRDDGQWFAIDVPQDAVLGDIELWAFDIAFYERGSSNIETGDHWKGFKPHADPFWTNERTKIIPYPLDTKVVLYDQDHTPLDYKDNPVICSNTNLLFPGEDGRPALPVPSLHQLPGAYESKWVHLNANCDFRVSKPGIYPVQVISNNDLGTAYGDGTNSFSLAATYGGCPPFGSNCAHPRVYGLGDLSVFFNSEGVSEFQLAEIRSDRAGENFLFRGFDLGDGTPRAGQQFSITIVPPPSVTLDECDYSVWDERTQTPSLEASYTADDCRIVTADSTGSKFNGKWIEVEVPVPAAYNCENLATPDCWWKVRYDTGGAIRDFATFQIFSLQDPVRLVN